MTNMLIKLNNYKGANELYDTTKIIDPKNVLSFLNKGA